MEAHEVAEAHGETVRRLRGDLVRVCRRAYWRGLTAGTGGNISVRLPGGGLRVLIKPTGASFADIRGEDFLIVDGDGRVLEGEGRPSVEARFHLAIYRCQPAVGAVLHGHAPYGNAVVAAHGRFPMATAGAELGLGNVPVVGYAPPGSLELAEGVARAFSNPDVRAVLLERHGFVTVGSNPYQAFYLADILEENAKTIFLIDRLSGK